MHRPSSCEVPTLLELALRLVEEYVEDVESLEGLPDMVRSRVAAHLCKRRKLSPEGERAGSRYCSMRRWG